MAPFHPNIKRIPLPPNSYTAYLHRAFVTTAALPIALFVFMCVLKAPGNMTIVPMISQHLEVLLSKLWIFKEYK